MDKYIALFCCTETPYSSKTEVVYINYYDTKEEAKNDIEGFPADDYLGTVFTLKSFNKIPTYFDFYKIVDLRDWMRDFT